jgi:hypothetical protein
VGLRRGTLRARALGSLILFLAAAHFERVHQEGTMTDADPRSRPDGKAWSEAQRSVQARNDEARKRGRAERAKTERRDAVRRAAAEQRGIYR